MSVNNPNTPMQKHIQQQLGAIRFLDKLVSNPFVFCFETVGFQHYKKEYLADLLYSNEASNSMMALKDEYEKSQIDRRLDSIVRNAESAARTAGFSESPKKKNSKLSLAITCSLLIVYFTIQSVAPEASEWLMFPIFIAVCFLPQIIRQKIESSWNKMVETNKENIERMNFEDYRDVRAYNQKVLNSLRDELVENKIPLQVFNFYLDSIEYENIIMKDSMTFRGATQYVVQFEYPPGVAPFEVPTSMMPNATGMGATSMPQSAIQELDVFHVLQNPVFDDDGKLISFDQKLAPFEQEEKIHALLNNSEIKSMTEPEKVIPFFRRNEKLECQCKEKLILKTIAFNTDTVSNFDYYFVEAKRCPICGANNYLLLETPGMPQIPTQHQTIFKF